MDFFCNLKKTFVFCSVCMLCRLYCTDTTSQTGCSVWKRTLIYVDVTDIRWHRSRAYVACSKEICSSVPCQHSVSLGSRWLSTATSRRRRMSMQTDLARTDFTLGTVRIRFVTPAYISIIYLRTLCKNA